MYNITITLMLELPANSIERKAAPLIALDDCDGSVSLAR